MKMENNIGFQSRVTYCCRRMLISRISSDSPVICLIAAAMSLLLNMTASGSEAVTQPRTGLYQAIGALYGTCEIRADGVLEVRGASAGGGYLGWTDEDLLRATLALKRWCGPISLHIPDTAVTDKGIKSLALLTNLVELDLASLKVTFNCFESLKDLSGLTRLDLTAVCPNNNEGFDGIVNFKSLRGLILRFTPVGDDEVRLLRQFPELTTLDLSGSKVTDAGIEALLCLKHVESLILERTNLTDRGIEYVSQMSSIRYLNLFHIEKLSGKSANYIAKMRNLEEIDLSSPPIPSAALKELRETNRMLRVRNFPILPM